MSTSMPAQSGHSEACCNMPPVIATGYNTQGHYETVGGLNTYVTGPASASRGLLFVFDIFGFFPQTLQGADILASAPGCCVLMPDLFGGKPCPIEVFPPDTPDKRQRLGDFFGKFPPLATADRLVAFLAAAKAQYPNLKQWDILGLCWGGKVACLTVKALPTAFCAIGACHPAMVDPADAPAVTVPMVLLASKDEDAAAVAKFAAALSVPNHVETFADSVHGWMGARANLENGRERGDFARGYKTVLDFFNSHH